MEPASGVEAVDTATVGDAIGRAGDIDGAGGGLEFDVGIGRADEVEGEDDNAFAGYTKDKGARPRDFNGSVEDPTWDFCSVDVSQSVVSSRSQD